MPPTPSGAKPNEPAPEQTEGAKAEEEAAAAKEGAEAAEASKEEKPLDPKAAALAARRAAKAVAEQERQARRRMLGNMQFIGQLYKYALLTERIMHNCVIQLLAVSNPGAAGAFVECRRAPMHRPRLPL